MALRRRLPAKDGRCSYRCRTVGRDFPHALASVATRKNTIYQRGIIMPTKSLPVSLLAGGSGGRGVAECGQVD